MADHAERRYVQGQALAEYAIILLFIALIVFVSLLALGPVVGAAYERAAAAFP